jgi:hypothetical protein
MLAIFNKNSFFAIAFSVIVAMALWIPDFGDIPQMEGSVAMMPLERSLVEWTAGHPLMSAIAAVLLLLVFALLIIKIEQAYLIAVQRLYLAPFLFVLLCSTFPAQRCISGAYLAGLLFLLALFFLFRFYKAAKVYDTVFYAGLLLGCAALFYAPAIFLVLLLSIALVLFRQTFRWREHIVAMFGVITPFFYTCIAYFFSDNNAWTIFDIFRKSLFVSYIPTYQDSYVTEKMYFAYLIFIMVQLLFLLLRGQLASKHNVKKIHVLLLWAFVILLCTSMFLPAGSMLLMPILAVPASILMANYFIFVRNRRWAGLQFIFLIVVTFGIRYLL